MLPFWTQINIKRPCCDCNLLNIHTTYLFNSLTTSGAQRPPCILPDSPIIQYAY